MQRLNFTLPMLERMAEGVILLDRQAAILGSNRAAEPWLASLTVLSAAMKRLIDEEVNGRVQFPVRIDLAVRKSGIHALPADVWLSKNGRRGYAIFIAPLQFAPKVAPLQGSSGLPMAEQQYISLFGEEVRHQISQLQAQIETLLQGDESALAQNAQTLREQAKAVHQLLKEISDLTQLMQRDLAFTDERIDVAARMQALVLELAPAQINRDITLSFTPDPVRSGAVYGNTPWMDYALRALLTSLIHGAPQHSRIALDAKQMGDFMVFTGRVGGDYAQSHISTAGSAEVPLLPVAKQSMQDATSLLMCRRIVDLHGGQLKLELLPSSDVESFTLTLATGAPPNERSRVSCAECRYPLQAQSYAMDLASLLANHSQ
jgi:signal transduction histidine kinase